MKKIKEPSDKVAQIALAALGAGLVLNTVNIAVDGVSWVTGGPNIPGKPAESAAIRGGGGALSVALAGLSLVGAWACYKGYKALA